MTVIYVDATIEGYSNQPKQIFLNASLDELYKSENIRDLVAMCVRSVTGLKLDDILDTADLELNEKPVDLDDSLGHHVDRAQKDALGVPQIKLSIEKPARKCRKN